MNMLIKQSLPLQYEDLTRVFVSSTDRTYVNTRLKKVHFYNPDLEAIGELIDKLLKLNLKHNFLLKPEKRFLIYAKKIFEKEGSTIKIQDYVNLLDYSFKAAVHRIVDIQNNLLHLIKKSKLTVDKMDDEYLFTIQNILDQVRVLNEEVKEFKKKDRDELISFCRRTQWVYRNLHEVVLSIVMTQYADIRNLSNAILQSTKIEFNYSNKIVA